MCEGLLRAAASAAADDAVRLVLVRANGPVFCAGADLKERQGMSGDQVRARRLKAFAAYDALERLPMPVIAVVHAAAVGSGCEIAAACDLRRGARGVVPRPKRSGARSARRSGRRACSGSGWRRT
jgi:enoyl-CoA hydratase